jgi:L-asparaginase II
MIGVLFHSSPSTDKEKIMSVPLVETTRAIDTNQGRKESVENIHFGNIAVVDRSGKLLASAGDPNFITFSRSTIKPFQATPFINDHGVDDLKLTEQEIALMCSSHSGESFHLEGVASLLRKAESTIDDLQCGCHAPYFYAINDQRPPRDSVWNASHNNCSGKHSGFLAWCQLHGAKKDSYLDPDHPLQQAIRKNLAIWTDTKQEQFMFGTDGCSAPNYALPLRALALSYARLADAKGGDTAKTLFAAMTNNPDYVSGTGRNDLAFMNMAPKDWVAKIGADGVQLIGIRSKGLGIAVKIADGNQRAVIAASIEVLRQLQLAPGLEDSPLATWLTPSIKNVRGIITGQARPCFQLTTY